MQQGAFGEPLAQAVDQLFGQDALGVAERGGIPFGAVHIVDGDEGRLAAHGQADIADLHLLVDMVAERLDALPLVFGVGQGDARILVDAGDAHLVEELHFAGVHAAGHGRGGGGLRRCGERDMALAGKEAGSGIEADPARARQIDFGPGVQVGEVGFGPGGTVERLDVGFQLNEIAGDEARGESEMAQDLHQQPGAVAARTALQRQGFFRGLDAGLEADDVPRHIHQPGVDFDQKVDSSTLRQVDGLDQCLQFGVAGSGTR